MLKSFCCMRLNTAGVVIGWVGAAASFLASVFMIFALANIDEVVKAAAQNMQDVKPADLRSLIIVVITIQLAINIINLTASALLVAGTIKERHLMLAPWLINSGLSLFFYGLYILLAIGSGISSYAPFLVILKTVSFALISFVIQYYIWYAIYSLYKQFQANSEQQRLVQSNQPQSPSYTKI